MMSSRSLRLPLLGSTVFNYHRGFDHNRFDHRIDQQQLEVCLLNVCTCAYNNVYQFANPACLVPTTLWLGFKDSY